MSQDIPTITVNQVKQYQKQNTPHHILDVRKPCEYEKGNIGGQLIPVDQLAENWQSLLTIKKPIFVLCRSGGRSARATQFLLGQGLQEVYNIQGGMLAWKETIDSSIEV